MRLKRFLRRATGLGEVLVHKFTRDRSTRPACIFYYHRVAEIGFIDPRLDDRNVSPAVFESHLAALVEFAEVIPLPELPQRLSRERSSNDKPLVSITFDDGYANFRSSVLPLLQRYQVPATLSVVTGYMETGQPAPFDRWARKNTGRVTPEAWRMLKWGELEECVSSGLVTLGAHSHLHSKANECTPGQLQDEVGTSAEILRRRFGKEHTQVYAYPFGNSLLGHVSEQYEKAVRAAGFSIGITTDVGLVSPLSNWFRLPRIEAHDQDSAATLRAKSAGAIAPLYLNEWFHKALAWDLNRRIRRDQTFPSADGDGNIPSVRTIGEKETGCLNG